jgi:hypothetical protein
VNVDQGPFEGVLLALMILKSTRDPNTASATQREVDELKSYLGDEAAGLSLDQIACTVIRGETKPQEQNHS